MSQEIELQANSIDEIHYKIMEIIRDYPPGQVLDFPSGFGRLSYWLQQKGHNVVACDIASDSYPNSPIIHTQADLNKEFPFENDTFDYAFCIDGPEHAENLYHTFREFFRVLKWNGTFIISMPNHSNIESRFKHLLYGVCEPITNKEAFNKSSIGTGAFHINRPSYALLRMSLEAAGFSIIDVTYDKDKTNQKFFIPIYILIKLITTIAGYKGNQKYWLKDANSKNVLMGGNTIIIISRKR
jgi:SAM-dependent methyltransferase